MPPSASRDGYRSPRTRTGPIWQRLRRHLVEMRLCALHKIYGASSEPESRYSPATCIGCDMKTVSGEPDPKHVSTSYVERQNLTMRMSMRRFTRLTNGFSKKVENHGHAVCALLRLLQFLPSSSSFRVTPAMEAGLTDHVWSVEELVALMPEPEAKKRGPYKKKFKSGE